MVDRFLGTLPSPSPVPRTPDVPTGNVNPADEGPEGPPKHVAPGAAPDPSASAPAPPGNSCPATRSTFRHYDEKVTPHPDRNRFSRRVSRPGSAWVLRAPARSGRTGDRDRLAAGDRCSRQVEHGLGPRAPREYRSLCQAAVTVKVGWGRSHRGRRLGGKK